MGCGRAVTDTSNKGLLSDCEVLLEAKDVLAGTASLNWSPSLRIDQWDGVRLDGLPERVTTIDLSEKGLTGQIPPELGKLTDLEWLSLDSNRLTGTIPPELGKLTDLESLWLFSNRLTGTIPPELGRLSSLTHLALSLNRLTGVIPPELGRLTNLEYFSLDYNQLTGCVPSNLREAYEEAGGRDYRFCPSSPPPTSEPTATPEPVSDEQIRSSLVTVTTSDSRYINYGTGIIVVSGESKFIVTSYHVVEPCVPKQTIHIERSDWDTEPISVQCVAKNSTNDVALLIPRRERDAHILGDGIPLALSDELGDTAQPFVYRRGTHVAHAVATRIDGRVYMDGSVAMVEFDLGEESVDLRCYWCAQTETVWSFYKTTVNPGDSGSPFVDQYGHLVGILSGGWDSYRLVIVTPVSAIRQLIDTVGD